MRYPAGMDPRLPFLALDRDRARSALGAAVLHGLIGWALVAGLGATLAPAPEARLTVFEVAPKPPPPAAPEPAKASPEPEGEAAPPNLRARPTEIVAPKPEIRIETPPPVVAAPVAANGPDPSAGAAETPGPGTGAGGAGDGLGSGGSGDGTGGGGGGIAARPAYRSGTITVRDLPDAAWRAQAGGSVTARLTIAPDGSVSACRVARSSGTAELDALTCRLIRERFRYEPARDRAGRAVQGTAGWRQDWWRGARD